MTKPYGVRQVEDIKKIVQDTLSVNDTIKFREAQGMRIRTYNSKSHDCDNSGVLSPTDISKIHGRRRRKNLRG